MHAVTSAELTGGILADRLAKVYRNDVEGIDAQTHAQVYADRKTHPETYAEPEFTGKYLDLCATCYEWRHDARALQNGQLVVDGIAQAMRGDGYIGALPDGQELAQFSVWNQSFTLYGLTRMYQATGDERTRQLAIRAADWILDTFADPLSPDILLAGNQGTQHISCLFPIGRLYALTGENRYASFLHRVIDRCEHSRLNLLSFTDVLALQATKGIEMLVVYLGILQYGQLFGNVQAIEAAQRYWVQINATQIRNTGNGTIQEHWTPNGNAPRLMPTEEKPNETCVAAGWIELSLALFHQEQKACYLDAIEKTLLNHMIGSLDRNGTDLAYYQGNYGKKIFRTGEGMYQCCRYRGFTIFTYLPRMMYHEAGHTLIPMIYGASEYHAPHWDVRQETNYPQEGTIHLTVCSKQPESLVKLRIPGWCKAWQLQVDGKACTALPTHGFVTIPLGQGDHAITLALEMPLVRQCHHIEGQAYQSFHYGPLLLAHDTRFHQPLWLPAAQDAPLTLAPPVEEAIIHAQCGELELIDFASAGRLHSGEDEYTVFCPICE